MSETEPLKSNGTPRGPTRLMSGLNKTLCQRVVHDSRVNVLVGISVHEARRVSDGLQMHIVLKFRYPESIIEDVFGAKKPEFEGRTTLKKYAGQDHLIPYIIFNAVEEKIIAWTYKIKEVEGVRESSERIETMTTLAYRSYTKYYPFELKLLPIKLGLDGTGKTNLVNLIVYHLNPGVFIRDTSPLTVGGLTRDSLENVVWGTYVRSTHDRLNLCDRAPHEGLPGVDCTQVNVIFFFDSSGIEELVKYVGIATLVMMTTVFLPSMQVSDIVQTGLACTLTGVALLFVLPETPEFTLTEQLIVFLSWFQLLMTWLVAYCVHQDYPTILGFQIVQEDGKGHVLLYFNATAALMTFCWACRGYSLFRKFVHDIKFGMREAGADLPYRVDGIDKTTSVRVQEAVEKYV